MDTEQLDPVALAREAYYLLTDRGEVASQEQFDASQEPMRKALGSFCGMLEVDGPEGVWEALGELDDPVIAHLLPAIVANLDGENLRYVALIGLLKLAEVVEAAESG